jgi:ABC-type nitrate/sulfonate/bicarbonate transport system permease component
MSVPPVTLMSRPRAPLIETSSSNGLEIARWAASTARFSPATVAAPIMAIPISAMMVRTSAKSRLMRPGTVTSSEMPRTACSSTSSAF